MCVAATIMIFESVVELARAFSVKDARFLHTPPNLLRALVGHD
jgi:hypothetical protein